MLLPLDVLVTKRQENGSTGSGGSSGLSGATIVSLIRREPYHGPS